MEYNMINIQDPVNPLFPADEQPTYAELLAVMPYTTFDYNDFDATDTQGHDLVGVAHYKGKEVVCFVGIEDGYPSWELSIAANVCAYIKHNGDPDDHIGSLFCRLRSAKVLLRIKIDSLRAWCHRKWQRLLLRIRARNH